MDKKKKQPKPKNRHNKINLKKHSTLAVITLNGILVLTNVMILLLLPNKAKSLIQVRSEILGQQLQNQSAQKLVSDLQATQAEKEIIYSVFPTKSRLLDIIQLFESLNNIAKLQDFNFESEEPRKDENGNAFLPVTLVLEGQLSQTMAALQKLKTSPYLITMRQTLIESPNGLSSNVIVRIRFRLYVQQPFKDN